jgi:hypothetical protein
VCAFVSVCVCARLRVGARASHLGFASLRHRVNEPVCDSVMVPSYVCLSL